MKRLNSINTIGLLLLALLPACSDDDGVTITEGDRERDAAVDNTGNGQTTDSAPTDDSSSKRDASGEPSPPAESDGGTSSSEPTEGFDGGGDGKGDAGHVTDTSEPDTTDVSEENALYAFGAQVYDGNTWLSYLATSPRLDTHVTLDDALEIRGRILAVGPAARGVTYVTNGPTVTRYRLNGSDRLEAESPSLSFAGVGVTDIHEYGGQFVFDSPSKSYFFDGDNSQIVVWNPDQMTVGQPIPLDILSLDVEGVTITSSASPIRNGNQVIQFVGLRQSVVPTTPAVVVVLDTEKDTAQVVTDDRCSYVRDGVLADDGWVYLATEAYASAYQRINLVDALPEPCLLRFDPKTKKFDPEFHVTLESLFDGGVAGSLSVARDGSVFLKVLDEELAPITAESNARVIASEPAWKWASLTLGDKPKGKLLDVPATSGSVTVFDLGNRRVVSTNRKAKVGGSEITVSDLSDFRTTPSDVIGTVDGLVFSITKLR